MHYIPNIITLLRLLAVLPCVALFWFECHVAALLVFALAGVSDGVDGYLARRFSWQSHWGAVMDPVADKLLLVFTAAAMTFKGMLPLALFILMMARDVIILAGAGVYRVKFGPFKVMPSVWGKLSTFFQIFMVIAILEHNAFGNLAELPLAVLMGLCAVFTLISGVHYCWVWLRKARTEQNKLTGS